MSLLLASSGTPREASSDRGGGYHHHYLISNVIAYLVMPAICIHRRIVGRESFRPRETTAYGPLGEKNSLPRCIFGANGKRRDKRGGAKDPNDERRAIMIIDCAVT